MARTPIPILPSEQDAALAETARQMLAHRTRDDEPLRVQLARADAEPLTLDLPPFITQLLVAALKETAAGHAITVVPIEAEITTQEAADFLNVSRPYLITLIDDGVLPVRMVGNQRRLPLKDVLAYKADNYAKRREALRQLVEYQQELGLE